MGKHQLSRLPLQFTIVIFLSDSSLQSEWLSKFIDLEVFVEHEFPRFPLKVARASLSTIIFLGIRAPASKFPPGCLFREGTSDHTPREYFAPGWIINLRESEKRFPCKLMVTLSTKLGCLDPGIIHSSCSMNGITEIRFLLFAPRSSATASEEFRSIRGIYQI